MMRSELIHAALRHLKAGSQPESLVADDQSSTITRRWRFRRREPSKSSRPRSAYTLLELLVSSVAASMLMVGMASAIIISTRAISPPTDQKAVLDAAQSSFIIADEIQSAVHVMDQNTTSVEFAVDDRDNDGEPEAIRYSFDGTQLLRTQNGTTGSLINDIATFSVTPDYLTVTETMNGSVSESALQTLSSVTSGGNTNTWSLDPYSPTGQSIDIAHPDNTVLWSITAVQLYLKRASWYQYGEKIIVQIREATGSGLPTTTVLAQASVPVSSLSTSYRLVTFPITGAERLLKTKKVCLVVQADDSVYGRAGRVAYTTKEFTPAGYMLASSYTDADWFLYSSQSLYFVVRGTRHTVDASSHEVERNYVAGYDLNMSPKGSSRAVRRRVRLMNTPEQLNAVWRLDFNFDPTDGIDVDYNGIQDWEFVGGGSFLPSISDSVLTLTAGQMLQTTGESNFDGLITVDVHCRGTSANPSGGGASLQIPFAAGSLRSGLITISTEKSAIGTQTAKVMAADGAAGQILARVNNLPDEILELRVVIDPPSNQVGVWINEIFQGRTTVARPLSSSGKRAIVGASGANAAFDFLSIRVGGI